jgi:DNA-binding LytR/AlgR family response regulator
MLTVGICDDHAEQVDLLRSWLAGHQDKEELIFVAADEPRRFLEEARGRRMDIVFLDIDMAGMDGIELAEKLKELNADTVVIYVTAYEKFALEAFRVRAFHYLVKPLTQDKVLAVLSEALAFIKRNRRTPKIKKVFSLQRRGETMTLDFSDIVCFEKVGHKIRIHLAGGFEEYYGSFAELIRQLEEQDFIRCHQGYIVCTDKIRVYRDNTLFLDGGLKAPVSRMFADQVRAALAKRLFGGEERP